MVVGLPLNVEAGFQVGAPGATHPFHDPASEVTKQYFYPAMWTRAVRNSCSEAREGDREPSSQKNLWDRTH